MSRRVFLAGEILHDGGGGVVCPKPRRLVQLAGGGRWHACNQVEKTDLLDIFFAKSGDNNYQPASSPPFFIGSPPTRSANPMVHDTRFGEDRPVGPGPFPVQPIGPPISPSRKMYGPTKFGFKPAAVRVEGFDCRDGPTRSITAVA